MAFLTLYFLFDEHGKGVSNYEKCRCEAGECEWTGRARFAKCWNRKTLAKKFEVEINTGFVKKYFKNHIAPITLKASKTANGKAARKRKKMVKMVTKKMPKTDKEIDSFIRAGKENNGQMLLMDVPIDVYDIERGLKGNDVYDGTCKKQSNNLEFYW